MTGRWSSTRLVATREVAQALRGKAFWITAGLLLLASTAAMVLPEVLGGDDEPSYDVALVGAGDGLSEALQQAVAATGGSVDLRVASSVSHARSLVLDDEVDLAVVDGEPPAILVRAGEHLQLLGAVRQALATASLLDGLERAGLSDAEVLDLLAPPPPTLEELDPGQADRRGAAFGLSLVMYLLLFMVMMNVANGVAVEKANRVSEVLLAIVRPGPLLFGKVLGVGLIGAVTLLCGALPVITKMALGGDLPDGLGGALAGGALWFVLGIALYLVLAGALGALVERQEEASSVVTPLSVLLVGAYFVGSTASDSPLATVLAYIPFTSPMVMPSRIAVGASSALEMAISAVLGVVAVLVAARVGVLVYRRAIVRTGKRLRLREVLLGA